MPGGGTLTITTGDHCLTPELAQGLEMKPGNYFQMTITDTGIGMNAKFRQPIFESFFTTKENAGTGLGLSSVCGIVKQSHGLIQATSQEGKGKTFEILLPPCEENEEARPDQRKPIAIVIAQGAGCILVVKDRNDVREFASSVLMRAGYDVITASSGNEAMDVLLHRRDKIHLLLTGVVMEGMSGSELADTFSQHHPNVPILFTSGYPADELVRYGVRQGIHEFLAKPFTPQELLSRIDRIFRHAQTAVQAQSDKA